MKKQLFRTWILMLICICSFSCLSAKNKPGREIVIKQAATTIPDATAKAKCEKNPASTNANDYFKITIPEITEYSGASSLGINTRNVIRSSKQKINGL